MPLAQCKHMTKKIIFYGSATVGERGQIVLPAKMRKEFNIKKGDKLLVIGNPHHTNIMLVNPETMNRYLEIMSENINQIKSSIK
jgi:AbrB family looped-hinge helix DNA binding protein